MARKNRQAGKKSVRQRDKLMRTAVSIAVAPGQPPRMMSAFEALRLADSRRQAGDRMSTGFICEQLLGTPAAASAARSIMLKIAIDMYRPREIRELADALIDDPPVDLFGIITLAKALHESDRSEESIEVLTRGMKEYPARPELPRERGIAWMTIGDKARASADFRRALRLDPAACNNYRNLAALGTLTDDELETLRHCRPAPGLEADVHAALAIACRKRGDIDGEFRHLGEANSRLGRDTTWRGEMDDLLTRRMIEIFDADYLASHQSEQLLPQTPIFIVGMPRSGSTLIEQILCSHPDVDACGETHLFLWNLKDWARRNTPGLEVPDCAQRMSREDFAALGREYVGGIRETYTDAAFFVDKQLENVLFVGFLALAIPNARFVHSVRHPLDTCLSCYQQAFSTVPYANDLDNLAIKYRNKTRLMDHWKSLLGDRIHTVAYENMVSDTAAQARALLEFCGLPWDDGVLEFHRTQRAVRTASVYQVRRGIYSTSVEKWKPYAKHLEPLRRALGLG